MSAAPPPLARAVVLTDDGTQPYSAALVAFDGTLAAPTMLSTLGTDAHVLGSKLPGFAALVAQLDQLNAAAAANLATLEA